MLGSKGVEYRFQISGMCRFRRHVKCMKKGQLRVFDWGHGIEGNEFHSFSYEAKRCCIIR